VVVLIAPAGYGKTALLTQWAMNDDRPFAWVDVQKADNDPRRLLGAISTALDAVTTDPPEIRNGRRRLSSDYSSAPLTKLAPRLADQEADFVLVLDDVHRLHQTEALAVLTTIAEHLSAGSQLALSARSEPALPLGHMRAHRVMAEVRLQDLAMTEEDAHRMLAVAGLELEPAQVRTLVERTEGWPAGLYLAALSVQEQPDVGRAVARFSGDDRLVADYLRDEFLSSLPPERLRFLMRTAVLDELSGPLCDAVLDQAGSAETLRKMSRGNLLLIPLDRHDERYRYHQLLDRKSVV